MGDSKRLVQVDVQQIYPKVSRPDLPDKRVEIRAVAIHETSNFVGQTADLLDSPFEQPKGVRQGDHDCRTVVIKLRLEVLEVKLTGHTVVTYRDALVARHSCRSWVGSMRGIRNENLAAHPALLEMRRPDHQDSGQFTMGASDRLR